MITNINEINPENWTAFNRGDKYNNKMNKLNTAGSITEYKKNNPNKETPQEYRERHQRNAEKYKDFSNRNKNNNNLYATTRGITDLSKTMERKSIHLKNNKSNILTTKERNPNMLNTQIKYKRKKNFLRPSN